MRTGWQQRCVCACVCAPFTSAHQQTATAIGVCVCVCVCVCMCVSVCVCVCVCVTQVDDVLDKQLAAHILNVHRQGAAPAPTEGQLPPIAPSLLRSYIALAKSYQPTIPEPLTGARVCLCAGMALMRDLVDTPVLNVEHARAHAPFLLNLLM